MAKKSQTYPANGTPYKGMWFEPSRLVSGVVRALDVMITRGAGPDASGLRVGDTGSRMSGFAYAGDCGPLQSFRGAGGFVGASPAGIRPGFNQLLPGTTGLPDDVQTMLPGNPGA
jgi:hypothetical protein